MQKGKKCESLSGSTGLQVSGSAIVCTICHHLESKERERERLAVGEARREQGTTRRVAGRMTCDTMNVHIEETKTTSEYAI